MAVATKNPVFLMFDEHGWPCDPPKARFMARILLDEEKNIDPIVKLYRFRARAWSHWDRQSFQTQPADLHEAEERLSKYLEAVVKFKAEL